MEPLQGNLIIFFLPDDQATSFAWEVNNDATKPPAHDAPLNTNFEYLPNGYPGAKLLKVNVFTGQIEYVITNSGHKFRQWPMPAEAEVRPQVLGAQLRVQWIVTKI